MNLTVSSMEQHKGFCKMQTGHILNKARYEWGNVFIWPFLEMRFLTSSLKSIYVTVNKALSNCYLAGCRDELISIFLLSSNIDCSREQLWQNPLCCIWSCKICTCPLWTVCLLHCLIQYVIYHYGWVLWGLWSREKCVWKKRGQQCPAMDKAMRCTDVQDLKENIVCYAGN